MTGIEDTCRHCSPRPARAASRCAWTRRRVRLSRDRRGTRRGVRLAPRTSGRSTCARSPSPSRCSGAARSCRTTAGRVRRPGVPARCSTRTAAWRRRSSRPSFDGEVAAILSVHQLAAATPVGARRAMPAAAPRPSSREAWCDATTAGIPISSRVSTVAPGEVLRLECEDGLARSAHARQHARGRRRSRPRARPSARRARCSSRARSRATSLEIEFLALRDRRLRRHGGHPGLRLPRRSVHRAVPGDLGDRGRPCAVAGAARCRRAAGIRSPASSVSRRRTSCWTAIARARGRRSRVHGGPVADCAAGVRAIPPRRQAGCARSRRASSGGNLDIRQLVAGSRLLLPVARRPARCSRSATCTSRRATGRCAAPRSRWPGRSPCGWACTATPRGAALPGLRDAGRPGAPLVRHDRDPTRRGHGPRRSPHARRSSG